MTRLTVTWRTVALVAAVLALVLGSCTGDDATTEPRPQPQPQPEPEPEPEWPVPLPTDRFVLGWTHTQYSADDWNDLTARKRAEELLEERAPVQNQHIMGFGVLNPEPSPDVYDWTSLDARVELMRRTAKTPIITLCCAPDWMKGGSAGKTDWSKIEVAPLTEHFADFAELAAKVAERYPDVKYFLVWNELKGFYDGRANRWRYEDYTAFYNQVYTAVKAVRPDAKIGGPYTVMQSTRSAVGTSHPSPFAGPWGVLDQRPLDAIEYWLANKVGADFLVIDGGLEPQERSLPADEITALDKFRTIHAWIKQRTDLPIWWAELYPVPPNSSDVVGAHLRALDVLASSGANVVLLWGTNDQLFTDIRKGNVQATALADALADWRAPDFAPASLPVLPAVGVGSIAAPSTTVAVGASAVTTTVAVGSATTTTVAVGSATTTTRSAR